MTSHAEQKERLKWYIKVINQGVPREGYHLYHVRPHIVYHLEKWLKKERDDLDGKGAPAASGFMKMRTSASVAVQALFAKLLLDVGYYKPETSLELVRFYCQGFTSLRNEHMSEESFRKKFYSPDRGTVAAARGILNEMLTRLEEI